ncbi:radical SAM protein [Desulfuromonas soudanensis]|uniref:Radical SAM protein n=1 Tax=Desulfuromonas soudanensis TaxID=1603606 RepID=A0A0M4DB02_9BACT|nr:B12-binding domain-containing radical SAM protein [Desulfuromonas soudanensis]ALC17442.1 radical SAM protein [Desulfuromonas soudanensis]
MKTILTTLHSKYIHPSLALPSLAAYCREGCGELLIREFTVHEPKESVLGVLLALEPDAVAFSVYLWNRRETLELVDALGAAAPGVRIVLGGPEVSFEGKELFARHPALSALVRGEGELPLHALLGAWLRGEEPAAVPRLAWRTAAGISEGPEGPLLTELDRIPSPFALGLVDTSRGFVYLETARGCPYDCAFCMSALDTSVRSFSMARIKDDLDLLMAAEVPRIKLVDRTFNYDARRAREIFRHILLHNRSSHFHFEIGAHLLDEATLELLRSVPAGTFQFEIGVQSTLPRTLQAIGRSSDLERLEKNIRSLQKEGNIHLHLDLIAGLPGEGYGDFLASIDRVLALQPHHLQIEPVKLLPGAPLRSQADRFKIRYDPNPPYTVMGTAELAFSELERLRGIGRLMDLTFNSGRFPTFLLALAETCGSMATGLQAMEGYWRRAELFRHPLSQRALFDGAWSFVSTAFSGEARQRLADGLGYDFARCERVAPEKIPEFLDTDLTAAERERARDRVRGAMEENRREGGRLQHFVAVFRHLPREEGRTLILFTYRTRGGSGMEVTAEPL